MERIDSLMKHQAYLQLMDHIAAKERGRRFCRHGLDHSLDVARIAHILNLEGSCGYARDVIYAAALLHDVGRGLLDATEPHHITSAAFARRVLPEVGFDPEETEEIAKAIFAHHEAGSIQGTLADLLYRADKLSRRCFECEMYEECYWPDERKNHVVSY